MSDKDSLRKKKNLIPGASFILLFVLYLNLRGDFVRTAIDWVVIILAIVYFVFVLGKYIINKNIKKEKLIVIFIVLFINLSFALNSTELKKLSNKEPVKCTLKFKIPEHELYPENIAWDPVSGDFFLGSMGQSRILRIKPDGSYSDFELSDKKNLLSGIGMKVDHKRKVLWVCTGKYNLHSDYSKQIPKTGILKYNIVSGKLIGSWFINEEQKSFYHIFNDIVIADNGDAYATTTLFERIYRIPSSGGEMELVFQQEKGQHNNGITITPDNKYLFITKYQGVFRFDIENGKTIDLKASNKQALNGIDGLYYYNRSLITIKPRFNQVTQLFLDKDLSEVKKEVVLVENHPDFKYPTTGVIVKDVLVFVATSFANVPRDRNKKDQHSDVLIYEIKLEKKNESN